MKNYFTLWLLFLGLSGSSANSFYDQLCIFNANWEKYEHFVPKEDPHYFGSDREYVQAHLKTVIGILRKNTLYKCNLEQIDTRNNLIEILENYASAGVFPKNYYCENRTPVFIDEHDTHCAVGYLLKETGYGKLAKEIAIKSNYAWIKNIPNSSFLAWQKSSGFSLEELKLIQGAYEFYLPNALILPNKHEIPQQPKCMVLYFEDDTKKWFKNKKKENIWCYGEGKNGILNGIWEQNYAKGIPWIKGYFKNGKRTGQWKEYYQGTQQLCRTENWRDDQLNGIRKRFDRSGVLIEEILFKNGSVVSKTNYDRTNDLIWIRKPLDASLLHTEVYTFGGALIGEGNEKIYNPGNLLWFQNIELTALNSAAITARDQSSSAPAQGGLFNQQPLVQYKKEGKWTFYHHTAENSKTQGTTTNLRDMLKRNYLHFGASLQTSLNNFSALNLTADFDSIQVVYTDNLLQHFYGFGEENYTHLFVDYYKNQIPRMINLPGYSRNKAVEPKPILKEFGQYNQDGQRIGTWKHFDAFGRLYKTEYYELPLGANEVMGSL